MKDFTVKNYFKLKRMWLLPVKQNTFSNVKGYPCVLTLSRHYTMSLAL